MPRQGSCRDRPLKFHRRAAVNLLGFASASGKTTAADEAVRLKLEINEGIAVSLSENDRAGHERPMAGYSPGR